MDEAPDRASETEETRVETISKGDVAPPLPEARPGSTVSRYVVIEEVGRGGMGRVVRAYDPKLQREVALKELHAAPLDDAGAARLVAEARAMAQLSHPNVVAVYDVETLEPRLFEKSPVVLVMEYVDGQTLKAWLETPELPWRDVVDRFVAAGRGIAAAHEVGLLHRDFKPSNVLLAEDGTVKVTDFGIAKSPAHVSKESSSDGYLETEDLTAPGTIMGTPRFMPPEQHLGEPLSHAADQYAFCLSLWVALCGASPFEREKGSSRRRHLANVKLSGPPAWPRSDVPKRIADAVLRGLEPQPEDRWPSLDALLEALEPSQGWRGRGALVAAVVVLPVGLGGAWLYDRAKTRAQQCSGAGEQLAGVWDDTRKAEVRRGFEGVDAPYAARAWAATASTLDDYAAAWGRGYEEACAATTIRGEQSPDLMDLRMACLGRASVELDAAVAVLADADSTVVQKSQEVVRGLPPVARCADIQALIADVDPPSPSEAEAVSLARRELANAKSLQRAGRYADGYRAVQAAREALIDSSYEPVQTELSLIDGSLLDDLGRYAEAQAALENALRLAMRSGQRDLARIAALQLMYVVGDRQQRFEHALRYRPVAEGLSMGEPMAEAKFRNHLASVLHGQGKYVEAETEYRAALELRLATSDVDPLAVAVARDNLATALLSLGRYADAESQCRASLSIRRAAQGHDHPNIATTHNNLALALGSQGKLEEAEAEHRAALVLWERTLGPDHPDVALARSNLAIALSGQGRHEDAEAEFRRALAIKQGVYGAEHASVAIAHVNLAGALRRQGKLAEAKIETQSALKGFEATLGLDHPHVATTYYTLADVLLEMDRANEALPAAERALEGRTRAAALDTQRADAAFLTARVLWDADAPLQDRERARRLARKARELYREAGEVGSQQLRAIEDWLDE